jgi:hypothetical protein
MTFTKFAVVVLAAAALAACDPSSDTGTPAAGPQSGSGATVSGRDGCLIGTWKVDVDDLAQQIATTTIATATGSGTGTITLTFSDTLKIAYAVSIVVAGPKTENLQLTMKDDVSGEAVSTDWQAGNGRLAGTIPANTVQTKLTATIGDQEQTAPATPTGGTLDLAHGGIAYTCAGNAATLSTPNATWKLTKA